MKQHILPKQAQEISEIEFYSLFPVRNSLGDNVVKRKDWDKFHHKKVTIGHMIQFLKEKNWNIQIHMVGDSFRVANDIQNGWAFSRTELCDALWEAVKYELNKGDN